MKNEWTEKRLKDLELLERLLNEVSKINSGSHCLEKIRDCIEMANSLNQGNIANGVPRFFGFIRSLAIEAQQKALAGRGDTQMTTPQKAIEVAESEGHCKLGQHVFLWKTSEAAKCIQFKGINSPYILISDPYGWKAPIEVVDARNRNLIEACKRVLDKKLTNI